MYILLIQRTQLVFGICNRLVVLAYGCFNISSVFWVKPGIYSFNRSVIGGYRALGLNFFILVSQYLGEYRLGLVIKI